MNQLAIFVVFAVLTICTAMNLRSKAHNKPLGLVKTAAVIEQNSPNCPSDWAGHAITDLTGVQPARCLTGQKAGECIPGVFVCDNVNDCGDASDEDLSICPPKDCDAFQTIAGMFKCLSTNVCVNTAYKCDYDDDCGDGSDEQNCQARQFRVNLRSKAHNKPTGLVKTAAIIEQNSPDCPNGGAKCLSGESAGECIPSSYLCDNWNDCGDASDEDLSICPLATCNGTAMFECQSTNVCVDVNSMCDDLDDCGDNSDEVDCSQDSSSSDCSRATEKALIKQALNKRPGSLAKTGVCPICYTACPAGSPNEGECIPDDWFCDNWNDCGDGSDESVASPGNCTKLTCDYDEFDCAPTNICIPNSWICDGDNDCGNLSDESNCSSSRVKAPTRHTSKKLHGKK